MNRHVIAAEPVQRLAFAPSIGGFSNVPMAEFAESIASLSPLPYGHQCAACAGGRIEQVTDDPGAERIAAFVAEPVAQSPTAKPLPR